MVGGPQRVGVAEVDLVLAEVALALRVLGLEAGRVHGVADPADERLDPRRAEHRVVDVVEVRRLEVAVALAPRVLVRVAEDEELELGARVRGPAALAEPGDLRAEDLAGRRGDVGAVGPREVREAHRRSLVPGDEPERVEVGVHREVAVAPLPGGHLVALDGVHLDVDGEQVVASLGAVRRHFIEEMPRGQAFALKPALHVGDGEQDGVDLAPVDALLEFLERHGR